ncbi:MAG: amidohydrolase family protein, partial [Delftia sp.]|nr:amidohydrolase family protein [Delftia sp.]
LQTIVRQAASDTPPGELIFGMEFSEYALDTDKFSPIIQALDAAAPGHPVFLMGISGHTSAVNSRALQLLAAPDDLPGIMRDAGGQPNGLLANKANDLAFSTFNARYGADEKAAAMIPQAIQKAHSVGITTLHALDGGFGVADETVHEFLELIPTLPLRFVLYFQTLDVDQVLGLGLPRTGGCILLDGDVGARAAALTEPYADDPTHCGTLYYTQEEIDAFVLKAHQA